ncbi:MAG: LacI family DNA-binding transcriptional regulator [Arachnia sp.]
MARVRIVDVAQRAGVSTATVSLVLNNVESRISEATAAAVRNAAAELGYSPDLTARSLRRQRTQLVGLVSDHVVTTPFAGLMVQGAQDACLERDHLLLIANTDGDTQVEHRLIDSLQARRVDGYLYARMRHEVAEIPRELAGATVVGLDVELAGRTSCVPDEYGGARAATQLLLDAGHHRIAHLRGHPRAPASTQRFAAFRALTAETVGFDESLVRVHADDDPRRDSVFAEQSARQLLGAPERPTAVFAFNDSMAIGVYRAAERLGLRIPQDLSVIGFDNQWLVAEEVNPPLTTVALPHRRMGWVAANALIDALTGVASDPALRIVACPLVRRESVAPPPRG